MITIHAPLGRRRTIPGADALRAGNERRWLHDVTRMAAILVLSTAASSASVLAQNTHSRLVLRIHSIRCIDESNGKYIERIGGDEIVLSGVAIDASGRAKRVVTLKAGKFEHDGATKRYSPPRDFHTFDLTSGPDFPRTLGMMFVVVERDEGGGFQTVVNALVNKVNSVASEAPKNGGRGGGTELLTKALLAAATGNVSGALADVLGQEVVGLIKGKLRDDIFPPQLGEMRVRSATARISRTGTSTNIRAVRAKAHGGAYEIRYSWRVE